MHVPAEMTGLAQLFVGRKALGGRYPMILVQAGMPVILLSNSLHGLSG